MSIAFRTQNHWKWLTENDYDYPPWSVSRPDSPRTLPTPRLRLEEGGWEALSTRHLPTCWMSIYSNPAGQLQWEEEWDPEIPNPYKTILEPIHHLLMMLLKEKKIINTESWFLKSSNKFKKFWASSSSTFLVIEIIIRQKKRERKNFLSQNRASQWVAFWFSLG